MYKRQELDPVELSDTLMRIIGEIEPVGSHDVDKQRMQNLIKLCSTIDCLLDEIIELVPYKDRPEASMKDIGEYTERWLADKCIWIRDYFEEML